MAAGGRMIWLQKNMYLAIGIALLVLALGVSAKLNLSQAAKVGELKGQADTLTHERDQVKLDLDAKIRVADALRVSLDQALEMIKVGKERAVAAWQQDYMRLTQETTALRRQTNEIYSSTASCKSLADLDIAAACPAAASSLRDRARRMSAP
jgi:hypothetical protein